MVTSTSMPKIGKIAVADLTHCESALAELEAVTGVRHRAKRHGWRGYSGLRYHGIQFILAYTGTKPPRERVVAWSIDGERIWLPSERDDDLAEICCRIGESSPLDFAIWHEFVCVDYGVVYRGSAPVPLSSEAAQENGIQLVRYAKDCTAHDHLYWQRWGGKVFVVHITGECGESLRFKYRLIDRHAGKFEPLPIHVRR